MRNPPEHCVIEDFLVKPERIHYLRFTLEAYEGLATVTTRDPSLGWVQVHMAPGCEVDVRKVLDSEKERLELRPLVRG